jgi:hypothetical protein
MHDRNAQRAAIHRPLIRLPDISGIRRSKQAQYGPSAHLRPKRRSRKIGAQGVQDIT